MHELASNEWAALRPLLPPDRAGPQTASHALATGLGRCWADTIGAPRAAIVLVGGNVELLGDVTLIPPGTLATLMTAALVDWERLFIATDERGAARCRQEIRPLGCWPRIIAVQDEPRAATPPPGAAVRRLDERDADALEGLDEDIRWIGDTWGGAAGLATSRCAFGAFVDGRLASVATQFTVGRRWVDIGIVTEELARGRGLAPACAALVVADVRTAGRLPCWSTTPLNSASRRVAEKLGFRPVRDDVVLVAGDPLPGVEPV